MEVNQQQQTSHNPELDLPTQTLPAQLQASSSQDPLVSPRDDVYRSLQSYPFHSDPSYQSGLSTILGHPTTPATHNELSDNPDLILQAQCFYFARKYGLEAIDIAEYKNFLAITCALQAQSQPHTSRDDGPTPPLERPDPVPRPSAPTPHTALTASSNTIQPISQIPDTTTPQTIAAESTDPTPPYPTSFADIVDLITQNKPIPGIEKIPETVLEPGSSRQDHTARRKKPWEKSEFVDTQAPGSTSDTATEPTGGDEDTQKGQAEVEKSTQTGEGVIRILQPGAIPDSGLLAKE